MEAKAREHEAKARQATTQDGLSHAISAAECYMQASRKAIRAPDKLRLSRKCQELILLGESFKKLKISSSPYKPPASDGPLSSRELTTAEKTILLQSGKLHGCKFPPWVADPDDSAWDKSDDLFIDNSTFSFSSHQQTILAGWRRPQELFDVDHEELHRSNVSTSDHYDLVQDVTTDCSVVASLCAASRHLKPGGKSLLSNIIWPFDKATGWPKLSSSGKYIVRLNLNGCFRKVVIDDRLPASKTSRSLFVVDRQNPHLLWPALLEKAYLKVRGGYDFPGSNSGTDLWALTGWIPEQLFLRSDDFDRERTWTRINNAFGFGDVMCSLGTGPLDKREEVALGLAGEHDYALLDVFQGPDGTRRMLLKNPWCDGLVWKGGSSTAVVQAISYPVSEPSLAQPAPSTPTSGQKLTGVFWIDYEDVIHHFETLYLNWNPTLFTHRQDHHFSWTIPDAVVGRSLAQNPQYTFTTPASGVVWVLLCRHYQDGQQAMEGQNQPLSVDHSRTTHGSASLGFITLYAFGSEHGGKQVLLPDRPLLPIHYVDSPQTLVRIEAEANKPYTLVVAQMQLPLLKYNFSLSVFGRCPISISKAQPRLPHQYSIEGSWTRTTSGGNASFATFYTNPQYLLKVSQPTRLVLLLSTDQDDLPIQVVLAWSNGKRVTNLAARDIICSSGEYKRQQTLAESKSMTSEVIDPGSYSIILSTFESGQLGRFLLHVEAAAPVHIEPIPADTAGKFITKLDSIPIDAFSPRRFKCRVSTSRLTRATFLVRHEDHHGQDTRIPPPSSTTTTTTLLMTGSLRLSVERGVGPDYETMTSTSNGCDSSAVASAAPMSLRTDEIDIEPEQVLLRRWYSSGQASYASGNPSDGLLWLVLERMGSMAGGQGGGEVCVEVLSDEKLVIGHWQALED